MRDSTRYRVRGVLKPGLPGATAYLADDLETNAPVELTVLSGDPGKVGALAAAFSGRAAVMRDVWGDPGLAIVYECARWDDGTVVLAAGHPSGPTLREVILRDFCLEPDRAVRLAIEIAQLLERVHSVGVVHGGLRPDNVVLTAPGDHVVLTRVGVEWLILQQAADGPVRSSAPAGRTAAYRAPEQALGTATERSDVYAAGAMLYEMLAGVPPLGPDPAGTLKARCPHLKPSLERVVIQALQPRPEARQADASVLCNDLWEARDSSERATVPEVASVPETVQPSGAGREYTRPVRVHKTAARRVLTVGGLVGAFVFGGWLAYPRTPVPPPPRPSVPASRAVMVAPAVSAREPAIDETRVRAERLPAPPVRGRDETAFKQPGSAARGPQRRETSGPRSSSSAPIQRPSFPRSAPSDPAPSESKSSAPVPPRAESRQAVEDSTAIIDWLLSQGDRRRP